MTTADLEKLLHDALVFGQKGLATPWVRVVIVLVVGWAATRLVRRFVDRALRASGRVQVAQIVDKLLWGLGLTAVVLSCAQILGVDLTGLLATAGVATVAIGFAAQTSLSNLIAGMFLVGDRPFDVGDWIEIDGRQGMVLEVSLMSTLIRTFDNVLVRMPNEVVLKATIVNYSRFPVRRVDLTVRSPYGSDLQKVRKILLDRVSKLPEVLLEPPPEVILRSLRDSYVEMEVRAWVPQREFLPCRTALVEAVNDCHVRGELQVAFPRVEVRGKDGEVVAAAAVLSEREPPVVARPGGLLGAPPTR